MSGRVSVPGPCVHPGAVCPSQGCVSVQGHSDALLWGLWDVPAELAAAGGMLSPGPGHGDVPQNCKRVKEKDEKKKKIPTKKKKGTVEK